MLETTTNITKEDICSGLEPNDLIELRGVVPLESRTLTEEINLQSRREARRPFSDEKLAQISGDLSQVHSLGGNPEVLP